MKEFMAKTLEVSTISEPAEKGKHMTKSEKALTPENKTPMCSKDFYAIPRSNDNEMVDGHTEVHKHDVAHSKELLYRYIPTHKKTGRVLEIGPGQARVTFNFLQHQFALIDCVEPSDELRKQAKQRMLNENRPYDIMYECTLQNLNLPFTVKYDAVWIQFVAQYISDGEFVQLLLKLKPHLIPERRIVIKENLTTDCDTIIVEG